jgi:hypothetical protein
MISAAGHAISEERVWLLAQTRKREIIIELAPGGGHFLSIRAFTRR